MISVVIMAMLLTHKEVLANRQVYPSEYAYYNIGSVQSAESASANCRRYPGGLKVGIFTEQFIHCDGAQLKLADSNLGSEQYISSDYYVWSASAGTHQLLFIFPTIVNLTTITLHYYSDSDRGLPRLRFYAVPESDNFDIWDAPVAFYRYVDVAAVSPGGEPAGRRNVSTEFNFNTKKVLLFKDKNVFAFAVSEVEFLNICTLSTTSKTISTTAVNAITTENVTRDMPTYMPGNTPSIQKRITTVAITTGQTKLTCEPGSGSSNYQGGRTASWLIAITLVILFTLSLSINMIVLAVWLCKKRKTRDKNAKVSEFEIEGNPCYEAAKMKQIDDAEAQCHVYEMVREKRNKQ